MFKLIKKLFYNYRCSIEFKAAKAEADRLYLKTGKEYHVLLIGGKYEVTDNGAVNLYNKRIKGKGQPMTTIRLREMALYSVRKK